jgi:FKBP-type peptidyl-prolyl cis-trans isomerase
MRRVAAFVIAPLLATVVLAGSSSAASPDTYKSVTVTGTFNTAPKVTIPKVTGTGALYTKTLIQGTGATLTAADGLVGNYIAYVWSGKTSKELGSSYTTGKPSLFSGQLLPGLETALVGQKLGSRVLAVIPPKLGFGTSGNSTAGIKGTDTLVFVIDMGSSFGQTYVPGTQTSTGGGKLPTVTPPAAGSTAGPTIKLPAKPAAPTSLQVKALITGKGAKVAKGQELVVQYTGVNYRTGQVFDSSWARKAAYDVPIGEGQVIKGWDLGLVGQAVGSRVLLVIPPADAYQSVGGQPTAGIKATDSLVFVVDILAAE